MSYFEDLTNKNPILLLDGGLSNVLESYGCNLNHSLWTAKLLIEDPESIVQAHYDYIRAGAQIISTISYQASLPGFTSLGIDQYEAVQLIIKSVDLAQIAVDKAIEQEIIEERPLIAGSLGPYGAFLVDGSEYRGNYGVSKNELRVFHSSRIDILKSTNIDLFGFETFPSYEEVSVIAELLMPIVIPSWISFSCKDDSYINDGTRIEECVELINDHPSIYAIGINCTHPQYISGLIKKIKVSTEKKIIIYPNSGEVYDPVSKTWLGLDQPLNFSKLAKEWINLGADIIGGCCRIGPRHISELKQML